MLMNTCSLEEGQSRQTRRLFSSTHNLYFMPMTAYKTPVIMRITPASPRAGVMTGVKGSSFEGLDDDSERVCRGRT